LKNQGIIFFASKAPTEKTKQKKKEKKAEREGESLVDVYPN